MGHTKSHTRKRLSAVYVIRNLVNNKVYVGQSRDVESRWNEERRYNRVNVYLKRAFTKYGLSSFSFEIAIITDDLDYWEKELIQRLHSMDPKRGYNLTSGGEGYYFTKNHRDRLSAIRKEACKDSKERKRLSTINIGNHHYPPKRVRCIETGKTWPSLKSMEPEYNRKYIAEVCSGKRSSYRNLHFKFIE